MEPELSKEAIRREKERLRKKQQRQRLRDEGQISDKPMKMKLIISHICEGKKTRVNLHDFGITLDMIPCDHSKIHPDVLDELKRSCGTNVVPPVEQPQEVTHKAMSLSEAEQVFDQAKNEGSITKDTCDTYKRNMSSIIKLMCCSEDDIIHCFKQYDQVFASLREAYKKVRTYKKMITPIISLGKYSKYFAEQVDIDKYRQEMSDERVVLAQQEKDIADEGSTVPWSSYVELRKQLGIDEPDSVRYLVLCLYTMIPPVRDNYGNVLIIQDGQDETPEEQNRYYPTSGRLVIGEYKTGKYYGIIDEVLPKRLQQIISQSLVSHPRRYLITKSWSYDNVYDSVKGGKLSAFITGHFVSCNINMIRHSCETYVDQVHSKFSLGELDLIRKIMGHSSRMGDLYSRRQTEDSIDYASKGSMGSNILESISCKLGGYM